MLKSFFGPQAQNFNWGGGGKEEGVENFWGEAIRFILRWLSLGGKKRKERRGKKEEEGKKSKERRGRKKRKAEEERKRKERKGNTSN